MTEVISVRFKNKGKIYYFDPAGIQVEKGSHVVVETAKGLEYAECVGGNHQVEDTAVRAPLRPVIRVATPEDDRIAEENRRHEEEAFRICRERIEKHQLDMKLVDVEYNFEGNKILFFFTSEGRVDFRELVKDLASVFKTRIELRQIGVRDEARLLGGLGICGKPFCCAQFLDDFQPVSIKMAKTQGLSLNPTKISGTCGRLMCCLKYEQDAYEELVKNVPKVDSFVETPAGKGSVLDVNLLKGTVRVKLEDQLETTIKTFRSDEISVLGGKAKRAEYLAMKAEEKVQEPSKPVQRPKKVVMPKAQTAEMTGEPLPETPAANKNEHSGKNKGGKSRPRPQRNGDNAGKPKQQHRPTPKQEKAENDSQSQGQTQGQDAQRQPKQHRRYRRRKPSENHEKPQGGE